MSKINKSALPSWLLSLQYFWRLAIPLWRFRNASRGTIEQRRANYRHNRALRGVLPFYAGKWIGIAFCLLQLTRVLSSLIPVAATDAAYSWSVALACAGAGIGFAFACVVTAVLVTGYLYLTWVKQ